MTSNPPADAGRGYTGSVAGDLSIGVLFLSWGLGAPGFLFAALFASPWFGEPITDAQAHRTAVYLAVAVALSLAAPIIGLVVALWTERKGATAAFGIALTLSLLGNGYLLSLAAR